MTGPGWPADPALEGPAGGLRPRRAPSDGVDEASGTVTARFPGQDTGGVLDRLERDWGVTVLQDGEDAVFRLAPSVRFEDLDYVWGALFEVLG